MKHFSLVLAVFSVAALLLFGCTQNGSNLSAIPGPTLGANGQLFGSASVTPAATVSSGGANPVNPSPSSGAYDPSGLDEVGPDIDNLDSLSNDLSAGDVSPPPDEAG